MRTPMAEFEWSTSIVNDVATTKTQLETEPDLQLYPQLCLVTLRETTILLFDILHPKPIRRKETVVYVKTVFVHK